MQYYNYIIRHLDGLANQKGYLIMEKEKHFFDSPAKKIIWILCMIPLLLIFIAGIAFIVNMIAKKSSIDAESAKNYAFTDAGIQPSAARFVYTEFEFDDGHFVYDVSFVADNTEYEYVIKASDGTILKKEPYNTPNTPVVTEITPTSDTTNNTGAQTTTEATSGSSQITLDDAKQIALKDAGLTESDVTFKQAKSDFDDGISVYEIDFYSNNKEYEYKIDAETGKILDREIDFDDKPVSNITDKPGNSADTTSDSTSDTTATDVSYIGIEKAKSIALSHAGLSASDVVFTKTKLDQENLQMVYEIEFQKGTTEYEYEIHAETGKILKYDIDIDD